MIIIPTAVEMHDKYNGEEKSMIRGNCVAMLLLKRSQILKEEKW